MTSVIYYVGDSPLASLIPAFDIAPSGCQAPLKYGVKMSDGSSLPSQFTFIATMGAQAINVFTTTFGLTGFYKMIIQVTDPLTGIIDSSETFEVTIECTKSISMLQNPIPS